MTDAELDDALHRLGDWKREYDSFNNGQWTTAASTSGMAKFDARVVEVGDTLHNARIALLKRIAEREECRCKK